MTSRKRIWTTVDDSDDDDIVVKKAAAAPRAAEYVFDSASDSAERIAAHYQTHGFVVVRALTPEECLANIKAQVVKILLKQPWQQTLVVRDAATGNVLDIERDTELCQGAYAAEYRRIDPRTLRVRVAVSRGVRRLL